MPNKAARQQQEQQQRKLSSGGQVCCKLCAISKFENYAPYQNLTSTRASNLHTPTSHSNIPPLNNKSNKEQCNHLPWQVSSAATSSFQQLLLRIFILLCYESVCCGMPPSGSLTNSLISGMFVRRTSGFSFVSACASSILHSLLLHLAARFCHVPHINLFNVTRAHCHNSFRFIR